MSTHQENQELLFGNESDQSESDTDHTASSAALNTASDEVASSGAAGEAAHVDFDLLDTSGRWMLKVLAGPNAGAEFSMHSGTEYLLGTDPQRCDIIFQDLSISRQHAKIAIDNRDKAILEDLGSRNGTLVDGEKINTIPVTNNLVVCMGTTTFLLIDRDAERSTIIAPRLFANLTDRTQASVGLEPAVESQKTLSTGGGIEQTAPPSHVQEAILAPIQSEIDRVKEAEKKAATEAHATHSFATLAVITCVILLLGIGTIALFQTEDVKTQVTVDAEKEISDRLHDFPAIRYSYNPVNKRLLLIGHVLTSVDRSRMIDSLQQLKFLSSIDYSNVVIDELVYREINQILAKNNAWRSITVSSPYAGKYVLSGFLKTKEQADELYDYISQNFSYVDLLEKKVIVEEDVLRQAARLLTDAGFRGIQPSLVGGELTLKGTIPTKEKEQFNKAVASLKLINGVRTLQVLVDETGQATAYIDLSDKYRTTGFSQKGAQVSVVINGKILSQGDSVDGMTITSISPSTVFLEKNGVKYKIDFNK